MTDFPLDRRSLLGGFGASLAFAPSGFAQAPWPQGRTLKLVVPFRRRARPTSWAA